MYVISKLFVSLTLYLLTYGIHNISNLYRFPLLRFRYWHSGGYYDTSGALKDMVQNHLFQILSIVAMEWPEQFSTTAMHDAQLRVLRALRPVEDIRDSLVLGQYKGYRQEKSVPTDSTTETYAALRLFIDNERWWNTPFYNPHR